MILITIIRSPLALRIMFNFSNHREFSPLGERSFPQTRAWRPTPILPSTILRPSDTPTRSRKIGSPLPPSRSQLKEASQLKWVILPSVTVVSLSYASL